MNLHFIILEISARKDWQTVLREELEQSSPLDYKRLEQLPLLDSFIKETVRFNPLDKRTSDFLFFSLPANRSTNLYER